MRGRRSEEGALNEWCSPQENCRSKAQKWAAFHATEAEELLDGQTCRQFQAGVSPAFVS
jgi:hypothetical protein